ncbi:GNAT family N-acetyltransferase [Oryzibacter oryziterrae]|uniref:GNAT family N-acetyltransferase n=1 Tax=Oryzibacter oryziterrae TaxID=2766474 RepID=UPI001EFFC1AD|nr:GNAT family N-acetyltransferase [Oryzibacter oryziterrae]
MDETMTDVPPDALAVDAFEMRVVDINRADLDQLHALSIGVGWPHRAEDWQFLRENGRGVVALDEIGRTLGSAMWFPQGDDFATVGMVITSPRLQAMGTGNWLMQHVLGECGNRSLRLNATRTARRLYLSLDFKPAQTVYQCQGEAVVPACLPALPADLQMRALDAGDLDEITALDAAAFGAPRGPLLTALMEKSAALGLYRAGRLVAFAFCRGFGRGHVIGPVVAESDDTARVVVAPFVVEHAGRFLRIDTHRESGPFNAFLADAGMPVFDTVLTMTQGGHFADPNRAEPGAPRTYGLVSQAFG